MLDSTLGLISLAASNSIVVFCFCNLIIAILLVGSSKPSSHYDMKPTVFPTIVDYDDDYLKISIVTESNGLIGTEEEEEEEEVSTMSIDMIEHTEEEEEEEEEDEELRRRVEEFIEKINRGWRAEKLQTYTLGQ